MGLWGMVSLLMDAQLRNLEWAYLPGTLRYVWRGLWRRSVSLCGSSVKGTWREDSLAGDPEGYIEKTLKTGITFHRGPIWGTWRRSRLPGTFERWIKGAMGMELLSLNRLRGGDLRGAPSLGILEDIFRKTPDTGFSLHGAPLEPRGTWYLGGGGRLVYRGLWKMDYGYVLSKVRKWASASVGAPLLGNMDRCFFLVGFLLEEFLLGLWEICKTPCRRVSLSIAVLLGKLEVVRLLGLLIEKIKYIWVRFLD